MLATRPLLTPYAPEASGRTASLRAALDEAVGKSTGPRSLRAALASFTPVRSVFIVMHGVSNDVVNRFEGFLAGMRKRFPKEMAHVLVVPLFWGCDLLGQATDNVGSRWAQLSGPSERAWAGVAKLKDTVGRIRHAFAVQGRQIPITVVAHSNGTVITVAALQEALELDNVVMLGSPLDVDNVRDATNVTRLALAASRVRGKLIHCWSPGDWVAGSLKGGTGSYGFPTKHGNLDIRDYPLDGRWNIIDAKVRNVGHSEWHHSDWIGKIQSWTPRSLPADLFLGRVASGDTVGVHEDSWVSPRALAAFEKIIPWSEADNTRTWWNDPQEPSKRGDGLKGTFHLLPGGMTTMFQYFDMDESGYKITVEEGAVRARIIRATWSQDGQDHQTRWKTIGPADGEVRDRCLAPDVYDAHFRLELQATGAEIAVCRLHFWAKDH